MKSQIEFSESIIYFVQPRMAQRGNRISIWGRKLEPAKRATENGALEGSVACFAGSIECINRVPRASPWALRSRRDSGIAHYTRLLSRTLGNQNYFANIFSRFHVCVSITGLRKCKHSIHVRTNPSLADSGHQSRNPVHHFLRLVPHVTKV